MELRIYAIILLLSISLMSCTDIKRKNEKLVNIKAENYNGTTFQKKHIVKNKLLKDSLKTEDIISFYKEFMQSYILEGSFIIESALRFVASGVASCNAIRLSFTESEAILVSTIFAILNVLPINIGP